MRGHEELDKDGIKDVYLEGSEYFADMKKPLLENVEGAYRSETSIIDSSHTFSEVTWVVSALKTGNGFFGHSKIVIEGINNNTKFIMQCDIKYEAYPDQHNLLNSKGYISEVTILSSDKATCDYSLYPSISYHASAENVKKMIESIRADKKQVEISLETKGNYLEYQFLGKHHFFSNADDGDNCAGWVLSKLVIAGCIKEKDGRAKPKPYKVTKPSNCCSCVLY